MTERSPPPNPRILHPWMKRLVVAYWASYILVPIFTGLLAYSWLPNESYNPKRHELLQGIEVGTRYEDHGVKPEMWRDRATGKVFAPELFSEHRQRESRRLAATWFAYGLIACLVYAWQTWFKSGEQFFSAFGRSVAVNLLVAGYIFWST